MRSPSLGARVSVATALLALVYSVWLLVVLGGWPGWVSVALSAVIGAALYTGPRSRAGANISTLLAGMFFAYALLGLLSIAPFYLPAAVLLMMAVLTAPPA